MKPANWWQKNLRPVLETYRPRNIVYNGDEPVHKWVEAHLKNGDAKSQTLFPEPIRNHRLETGDSQGGPVRVPARAGRRRFLSPAIGGLRCRPGEPCPAIALLVGTVQLDCDFNVIASTCGGPEG